MILRTQSVHYLLAGLMLLLAACAPSAPQIPVTGETSAFTTPTAFPNLPPEAVLEAQRWLAGQLSTAVEQVQLIEVEQAEWTDSCLGLGQPNESCLQAITPGWRAIFEINGQHYEVRTDETGSTIRLASPEGTPSAGVTLENTQWNLISFRSPDGEQPLANTSMITLMLADGQVGGFGGCNSYGGTYQLNGNNISMGEITRTLKACADAQLTEQEERYIQALESAGQYELSGNQLVITYNNGTGSLIFELLPAGPGTPTPPTETSGG